MMPPRFPEWAPFLGLCGHRREQRHRKMCQSLSQTDRSAVSGPDRSQPVPIEDAVQLEWASVFLRKFYRGVCPNIGAEGIPLAFPQEAEVQPGRDRNGQMPRDSSGESAHVRGVKPGCAQRHVLSIPEQLFPSAPELQNLPGQVELCTPVREGFEE